MNEIKVQRAKFGMTQTDLSEKLGVSVLTIKRWESGEADPRGSHVAHMAAIFGCSTDYLLGLEGE